MYHAFTVNAVSTYRFERDISKHLKNLMLMPNIEETDFVRTTTNTQILVV